MYVSGLTVTGILIRFALGGSAAAASYILAKSLSGRWGGIFAAFPAVYTAAIITVALGLPAGQGLPLALQISHGALVGMAANIICAAAAAVLVNSQGWKWGMINSLGIWLVTVSLIWGVIYF